jgi:hypothetical protein
MGWGFCCSLRPEENRPSGCTGAWRTEQSCPPGGRGGRGFTGRAQASDPRADRRAVPTAAGGRPPRSSGVRSMAAAPAGVDSTGRQSRCSEGSQGLTCDVPSFTRHSGETARGLCKLFCVVRAPARRGVKLSLRDSRRRHRTYTRRARRGAAPVAASMSNFPILA